MSEENFDDFNPPPISPPSVAPKGNEGMPEGAPKKRGRPKLPRDAAGNILYPDGTVKKPRASASRAAPEMPSEPPPALMSDDETAQTFEGLFLIASMGLGDHWALMPDESAKLGKCFGPIFRRYPEKLGPYMDMLMLGPVTASIIIPRIAVQKMIAEGNVPKENSRDALLGMRAGMKAAEYVQIDKLAREAANERQKNAQPMANAIAHSV